MKKKQSSKNAPKSVFKSELEVRIVRGITFSCLSVVIFLSLLSYIYGSDSVNWLGLMGHAVGRLVLALFGLGGYLVSAYFGWLGFRYLANLPFKFAILKAFFFSCLLISFCILLSLLEDTAPKVADFMGKYLYKNLWEHKMRFHLGGALFYYLYHDVPFLNLYRIFNTMGIALIFSSIFLASFFFLTSLNPVKLAYKTIKLVLSPLVTLFSTPAFEKVEEKKVEPEEKEKKPVIIDEEPKKESNFMRFVKLRIPDSAPQIQSANQKGQSSSQDLLAIHPETNLTVRPSLSMKESREYPEDNFEEKVPKVVKKEINPNFKNQSADNTFSLPQPTSSKILPIKEIQKPVESKREQALAAQKVYNGDYKDYKIPSTNLLTVPKKVDQSSLKQDLRRQAEVLEETLSSFGIEAKVGQINCGPTINSFEVHPSIGVKVQKIKALENDIALNMEAKSIRIIAPIPGKAAVGIEVPNPHPQEVGFRDMLNAYQQGAKKFHIPILLGKTVNGDYVMNDLAKMPHCIIAGATGSGKSVCINTIVMSILLNAKPDEIRLIMVDPKKVELTAYSKLPHMLAPVITEAQGACAALNWLVKEMERRYELLKQVGLRNIEAFNTRRIDKELESKLNMEVPEKMHYIVGIIDELADLMMVSSNDIETPIARIAQMARAVGIHLILATQRPSREVITGIIKANFPTRIAFKVASRINSQIILDETGAESLLGNGDMLFLPPGSSHLIRAQGAFIRDEDINAVVQKICEQAPPNYVIASFDAMAYSEEGSSSTAMSDEPTDTLYDQALEIVLSTGNASTTFLQRKLKIGYARAASLMDQLESKGVVSPPDGSKARKVLSLVPNQPDLFEKKQNPEDGEL